MGRLFPAEGEENGEWVLRTATLSLMPAAGDPPVLQPGRTLGDARAASQTGGIQGGMKLTLVAVGHRQPDWVEEGCTEYLQAHASGIDRRRDRSQARASGFQARISSLAAEKSRAFAKQFPGSVRPLSSTSAVKT